MNRNRIIYHGSQQIVEVPQYGIGKEYNDCGRGFYCTESIELAQEALANESGVSLNTIRAYERKSKDLNKAQFDIVMRLAKTLKCEAADLLE